MVQSRICPVGICSNGPKLICGLCECSTVSVTGFDPDVTREAGNDSDDQQGLDVSFQHVCLFTQHVKNVQSSKVIKATA